MIFSKNYRLGRYKDIPGKDLSERPLSPNGIDSHAEGTEEVLGSSSRSHTPTSIPGTATPKNKGII